VKRRLYTITVAGAPSSVNRGGGGVRAAHWGTAHREKQRWQKVFMDELMVRSVPRKMHACTVDVKLRFKGRYHRDLENYRHPITKPLADALVTGGWLEDDTDDYFKVATFEMEEGAAINSPGVNAEIVIQFDALYAQGRIT